MFRKSVHVVEDQYEQQLSVYGGQSMSTFLLFDVRVEVICTITSMQPSVKERDSRT